MKIAFRDHAATMFMLLAAALFYAALFFVDAPVSRHAASETRSAQEREIKTLAQKEQRFRENLHEHPNLTQGALLGFAGVFVLGLCLDAALVKERLCGRPWISSTGAFPGGSWGISDMARVMAFLFFAEAVIAGAELVAYAFFPVKPISEELLLMGNSFLRNLAVAVFIGWVVRKKFRHSLKDLGLTAADLLKNIQRGLLGYIAMIPLLVLSLMALTAAAQVISYEPPPQKVVQIFLEETSRHALIFFTFFVALLGPVFEEIFFRGFAYTALRSRWGAKWAMGLTAAVFAAFHMNLFVFIPIFFLGLFLAYLYEKTGSLVPSITAHVAHNVLMVTMTLIFRSLSAGS